ncbi:hypothetical protein IAQ61_005974 [Plenodomus lingam]|uniref:Predicted protein n=1 Tax=Leptosphaeria maculans (strain JN3 / isolate v23.1.3 / race Av1-4-5-6-7-8) TaxID=985895 RepID=E4ZN44_LEPMJ|nr:predicted protein [Plenodomus lingam JN3]KAH9870499.1 hypothetical protein IAQ61_005974 [Plenodomus lingam]CBX92647.1 predicted protein [Plenodomus lingam JN3]
MAEEFVKENFGDTPHESHEVDVHSYNEFGISPEQSPRGGPAPFELPPARQRETLSGTFEDTEGNLSHHSHVDNPNIIASSSILSAHRIHEGNEEDEEPDIEKHADGEPRDPRLLQGKANTSTFDAPTKSSMAKQNEKVDLPSTVRKTSTISSSNQTTRLDSLRRQRSLFSEGRGGPSYLGNTSSVAISRPGFERTSSSGREETVEIPNLIVRSPGKSRRRMQRSHTLDPFHLESFTSSSDTASTSKALHVIADANQPREGNSSFQGYFDDAVRDQYIKPEKQLQAVQDQDNESLPERQISLEDYAQLQEKNNELVCQVVELENRIETCYLQDKAPDNLEDALIEIALLRAAGLNVKKAEEEMEDARAWAQQTDDELMQLKDDLEFLESCVKERFASLVNGTNESALVRGKIQFGDFASVANYHAASLLQLFQEFEKAIEALKEENYQLNGKLDMEIRLSKYLSEKKTSSIGSGSALTFQNQKLYEEEQKKRKSLEAKLQDFQDVAAASMDRELKLEITKLKNELAEFQLEASKHQANARLWQEESRIARHELEKRNRGFKEENDSQKKEMRLYIKDYYNKTKDASHWNLRDLQTEIATLESQLQKTTSQFSATKSENACLREEIEELYQKLQGTERFINEGLVYADIDFTPSSLPPDPDPDITSSSTARSSSPISWLATRDFKRSVPRYPPRFVLKQQQYEAAMVQFRQKQEARRRVEDDALDDLMEKLRRYRMGVLGVRYPPSKGTGWEAVRKKSLWDRWDGEGWTREVQLSKTEERLARELKGKGGMGIGDF